MQSAATVKCPLELEIAKKVVLPRLRDIAKSDPPRSKNHMYDVWVEKYGPLSRARFDSWLDMLEISFIKIVVVDGLDDDDDKPKQESPTNRMNDFEGFDNEDDGEVAG